jgi:DNA-binding transcriptional regulator PaaX
MMRLATYSSAFSPYHAGATISVTKLKDELRRVGISDAISSRALLTMEKKGDVRLGKERRSVTRLIPKRPTDQ